MDYKTIFQQLKKKQFLPLYFLHGEESYFIDSIVDYIEKNALDESERSFNQTVLYGKDVDFKAVLDNARRYPVMTNFQVVIVKEAQDMKTLDQLESYFKNPLETTILVLAHKHKSIDKRKKYSKVLAETEKAGKACVFESERLYDNQVPGWIEGYLRDHKIGIEADAVQMLADYLGSDLGKISNELDKLLINLPEGQTISKDLIQKNIGISKDFNVFELQSAIARRDVQRVFLIVDYFIANPKNNPLPMVISALYNYFSKVYACKFLPNLNDDLTVAQALGINRFFAKDYRQAANNFTRPQAENILHLLKEYDLRSKGVFVETPDDQFNSHTPHSELMREMVYRMLN